MNTTGRTIALFCIATLLAATKILLWSF